MGISLPYATKKPRLITGAFSGSHIGSGETIKFALRDSEAIVNPDAMFALTDPAKPEGKNTLYYFLEMERAKIGHYVNGEPSIMKKLGKYPIRTTPALTQAQP